jgi:BirA family biotin operon repressor/biotin-[acetyl-CoA-carboxylase] ligase
MWHSEKGGGLYFSIVLRPNLEQKDLPILTLLAAVAVYDTLSRLYDVEVDIKWPNDILIDDKKVCGILSEACETSLGTAVVVGIGINYNNDDLNEELALTATSLAEASGSEPDRDLVLQTLTYFQAAHYDQLIFQGNCADVLGNWAARSTFYRGKEVLIRTRTGVIEGVTDGLDQSGALIVKTGDGHVISVTAGDIEALRPKEIENDQTDNEQESASSPDVKTS